MPDLNADNRAMVEAFKSVLAQDDIRRRVAEEFLDGKAYTREEAASWAASGLRMLAAGKAVVGRILVIVKVLDDAFFDAFYTSLRLSRVTAWRYMGDALVTRELSLKRLYALPDDVVRLLNECDLQPEEVKFLETQGFFKGMDPLQAACQRPGELKMVERYQKKTREQLIVAILEILRERDDSQDTVRRLQAEVRGKKADPSVTELDRLTLAHEGAGGRLAKYLTNGAEAVEVSEKAPQIMRRLRAQLEAIQNAFAEAAEPAT